MSHASPGCAAKICGTRQSPGTDGPRLRPICRGCQRLQHIACVDTAVANLTLSKLEKVPRRIQIVPDSEHGEVVQNGSTRWSLLSRRVFPRNRNVDPRDNRGLGASKAVLWGGANGVACARDTELILKRARRTDRKGPDSVARHVVFVSTSVKLFFDENALDSHLR